MKIGVILNSMPYGGGTFQYNETILDGLQYIKDKDSSIEVVAVYQNDLWRKYLKRYSFKTVKTDLFFNSFMLDIFSVEEVRKILSKIHLGVKAVKEENCDVWICPSQDMWSFLLEAPVIATIHDLMHRYKKTFPEVHSEYNEREFLYSNMCKYSKKILVDSECGKDQVSESYSIDKDKLEILPYIPPKYILKNNYNDNTDIRSKYNIYGKYVFYPAQFWEHKNHVRLIRAMNIVHKSIPEVKLVLTGSTKYSGYTKVLSEIRKLNLNSNVIILGYIDEEDMPLIYENAELMVMPTFFGPTNIPPLEALALNCPMAISNIYGMPQQIGSAALYFDPNSVEEMSDCIVRIINNEDGIRDRLIRNCKVEMKRHTSEKFYLKFYEIIKSSIN